MWTRIQTVVDGNSVSGDWTICRNDVPVGRIAYTPQGAGVASWVWLLLDDQGAHGRAWTEEAALSAVKDASAGEGQSAA